MSLLQSRQDDGMVCSSGMSLTSKLVMFPADGSSPFSTLFVDTPRYSNAITKAANFDLMQRLSSLIPWNKLQCPSNRHSGSRISAALSILMPEMGQDQHDILSTKLIASKSGIEDHLNVVLYLISNKLTSRDNPDEDIEETMNREDGIILKLLNDTGWDGLKHLEILLSTPEPTAQAITEKVFACALRARHFEILERMLRSGMNPNRLVKVMIAEEGACFCTPLQSAVHGTECVRLIDLLIQYGAEVDFSIRGDGETALYEALIMKNEPAIRALLLQGATVTWACAHVAGSMSPEEIQDINLIEVITKIYLDQNLDTAVEDPEILVPAVQYKNVPMIQIFLARGAKLNGLTSQIYMNAREPLRTTLLGHTVLRRNIHLVRLLTHVHTGMREIQSRPPYVSPLALAAAEGLTDICDVLLSCGADIKAADEGEITLLERAVRNNNPTICQMLIKRGAKIDREPCDSQKSPSALLIAVQQSSLAIIDLLIKFNARMNDWFEMAPGTVLAAAIEVGDEAVIVKLINAGARRTGARMARIGNLQTAIFLQNIGALEKVLLLSGPKLLAAAISARHDDLAYFLLQNNADKELEPWHTVTTSLTQKPLRPAVQTQNVTFIQALLGRGAEVTDDVLTDSMENVELLPVLLLYFSGNASTAVACALMQTSRTGLELLREADVGLIGGPRVFEHKWISSAMRDFGVKSLLEIAAWKAKSTHFK